jgi:hypothetical protein
MKNSPVPVAETPQTPFAGGPAGGGASGDVAVAIERDDADRAKLVIVGICELGARRWRRGVILMTRWSTTMNRG